MWTNVNKYFEELPRDFLKSGMVIEYRRPQYESLGESGGWKWKFTGLDEKIDKVLVGDLNAINGSCDDCSFFDKKDFIVRFMVLSF